MFQKCFKNKSCKISLSNTVVTKSRFKIPRSVHKSPRKAYAAHSIQNPSLPRRLDLVLLCLELTAFLTMTMEENSYLKRSVPYVIKFEQFMRTSKALRNKYNVFLSSICLAPKLTQEETSLINMLIGNWIHKYLEEQ